MQPKLQSCVAVAALLLALPAAYGVRSEPPRSPPLSAADDPPATVDRDEDAGRIQLHIPDLGQPPDVPSNGWCGEAAIQQALLFHGAYLPLNDINRAGKPAHEDLYAQDIPNALRALGVQYLFAPDHRDLYAFIAWIGEEIDAGNPVLTGMKIYPSAHENWGLDHFTLAVGYQEDALIINTTWKDQQAIPIEQLESTEKGLAIENKFGSYYGISIRGPALEKEQPRARLFVTGEKEKNLEAILKCEGLTAGVRYAVFKTGSIGGKGEKLGTFEAAGPDHAFKTTLHKAKSAVFSCRAVQQ